MIEYCQINNEIKLAYKIIGEPNSSKPLLVFLHEGMGCIERFKDFPDKVCNLLKLPGLVYDRYGYGYSSELKTERNDLYLHEEAEKYLPELLIKLNLPYTSLILIGHSDGATIALLFASNFQNKIKYIVSMAAHVFVEDISVKNVSELEKTYYENSVFREKLKKYHFNHSESTLLAFTRTITRSSFRSWNIENYLLKIKCPVLVIQGENDEYGTVKQVDSIIHNCNNTKNQKHIIRGCGHSPHLEMQEIVLALIESFNKTI